MKNNVYVRSHRSIKSISLLRIGLLIPLIIYGFYKNGIYLYINHYVDIMGLFKPLFYIGIGALSGALVNIIYEYIFNKHKGKLSEALFASFHIEYGILLGCLVSINTNILIFTCVTFVLFLISKFIKNRINIMALIFIFIYVIQMYLTKSYVYANVYETSRVFSLDFMDYMVGRGTGGIASTHIILLIISMLGISISNNNKTNITLSSIITMIIAFGCYSIVTKVPIGSILLTNNMIFVCAYIATDYVTSSYTSNGEVVFGILVGALTFGFYFVNPILAPFIAILVVSLFNNLIDRLSNKLNK